MDENKKNFEQPEDETAEAGMIIRADYIEEQPAELSKQETAEKKEEKGNKVKKKKDPMREILEWVGAIVLALILTITLKTFVFDIARIDGESMMPTLKNGERYVMVKLGYKPQRGDIVVLDAHYKAREAYFENRRENDEEFNGFDEFVLMRLNTKRARAIGINEHHYVKRIIAMEGDVVDIDPSSGNVSVNGKVLEEDYLAEGTTTPYGHGILYPYTVEEGHVFVMGDNRGNSTDSRYDTLGTVPVEAIYGKLNFRIWPLG